VWNESRVSDRRLARIVKRCRDLPGHELFQYIGDDGHRHTVGSSEVNAYLREISGEEITAKDFRTWAGTFLAASALRELARVAGEARASTLVRAAEQVSRHLGNTVAVCRKCYVHPAIFDGYLDGSLIKTLEQRVSRYQSAHIERMSAEEAAVTAFLRLRLRSAKRLRPAARELTAGNARRSIRLKAL
jgi:DNA topoisomerase-1